MKMFFITIVSICTLSSPVICTADFIGGCGGGGCKYSFTLEGEIHGLPSDSPLAAWVHNGDHYSVSGYFTSSGALSIKQIRLDPDPIVGAGGSIILEPNPDLGGGGGTLVLDLNPLGCASGCVTTVTVRPLFQSGFRTIPNVTTRPTIKLEFSDPIGEITLDNLQDHFTHLQAIQFPTLGLSTTGLSETWTPTVTKFQLGLLPAMPGPVGCGAGGCKYPFSFSGKIPDVPSDSPLAGLAGAGFSASGDFSSNGTLNISQFKIMPDPDHGGGGSIIMEPNPDKCGGGGCLVAEVDPSACGGGGCYAITLTPELLFNDNTLGSVKVAPVMKFTFNDPSGAITLNNLWGYLSQLHSVNFSTFGLSAGTYVETWHPEPRTYSLLVAPLDTTPPIIDFGTTCPATPLNLNNQASLQVVVNDDQSGVASQSLPNGPYALDTTTVGQKTVTVTATNKDGKSSSQSCSYRVIYDFLGAGGFTSPIVEPPGINAAKAGSTVPVKWQLPDGNGGFIDNLGAMTGIQYQQSTCQGFASLENTINADTSGASGLHYDLTTNQFVYNWKTAKAMAGKCYIMTLKLNDGSEYKANFSLK